MDNLQPSNLNDFVFFSLLDVSMMHEAVCYDGQQGLAWVSSAMIGYVLET